MALVPGNRHLFILCGRCDDFFEEGKGGACKRCGFPLPSTASEERWWDLHSWLLEDLEEAARRTRICVHGCPFHDIYVRHGLTMRLGVWRRCGLEWWMRRHHSADEFTFRIGGPEWIDLSPEEDEWEPCRCCGGWDLEVEEIGSDSDAIPIHSVRCLSCGLSGPRLVGPKQNAWDAWDERDEQDEDLPRNDLSPLMRGYRKGTEPPTRGREISAALAAPCPFCGSLPSWSGSILTCPHCEAGLWKEGLFLEALRRWNRRAAVRSS